MTKTNLNSSGRTIQFPEEHYDVTGKLTIVTTTVEGSNIKFMKFTRVTTYGIRKKTIDEINIHHRFQSDEKEKQFTVSETYC